ncbi:MAG: hypothetical protein HKP62_04535 [Sulfurovum sp.]|nr:hypothetical protein [Sulfurovum sp.]NNJ45265.1 hypothetical protein [Sulfurovum sp.]
MGQFQERFGYYDADSYCVYDAKAFFDNGGRNLYGIRVVGDDARNAGGADDDKVDTSKAQLILDSATDKELQLQADTAGISGALVSLTIETAAVDDKTTVAVADTYDITLTLAKTSAWKKGSKLASYVINGYAHAVISGEAVPAANGSVCFYAASPGTTGNNYSVTVTDVGVGGAFSVADCSYSADGYDLTIDLDSDTPTATVVAAAVNSLAGGIEAFVVGTGASTWTATVTATDLEGGSADASALVTANWGVGTGLTATDTETKTYLLGTGSVTASSATFTDTTNITALTAVTSKVISGDKLVIHNGANEGCYEIEEVTGETTFTVTENFATTQANCLYTIMGTSGEYGHLAADLLSPGEDGDNFTITLSLDNAGTGVDVIIQVEEETGATTILEKWSSLSPIPTNADYIQTVVNSESEWLDLDLFPQTIKYSGTASSAAGDATITDAGETFEDSGVSVGDLFICTSATTTADVRVYEITEVTDNTHLEVDTNFTGTQADVVYVIVGDDSTGNELIGLLSSDITITFDGGVDDTPDKADYQGDETSRTGVYAIDDIPVVNRPRKLWVPNAPIIVDSSGVDATNSINISMGNFCSSRQYLRYSFAGEQGLTPAQTVSAASSDTIDNKYTAEYYNWIKVDDPLTGNYKWIPPTGHMNGQADAFAAGAQGLVAPVANSPLAYAVDVEYEVSEAEEILLNNAQINPIIKFNGIRNMGDYVRTTDADWKWLHKRDVTIVVTQSIKNSLATWGNWQVKSTAFLGKVRKSIMGYFRKYDMRYNPNGWFQNATDPSADPYYVVCDITNNDLGEPDVYVTIGFSIPESVQEITVTYGLWDGGTVSIES